MDARDSQRRSRRSRRQISINTVRTQWEQTLYNESSKQINFKIIVFHDRQHQHFISKVVSNTKWETNALSCIESFITTENKHFWKEFMIFLVFCSWSCILTFLLSKKWKCGKSFYWCQTKKCKSRKKKKIHMKFKFISLKAKNWILFGLKSLARFIDCVEQDEGTSIRRERKCKGYIFPTSTKLVGQFFLHFPQTILSPKTRFQIALLHFFSSSKNHVSSI